VYEVVNGEYKIKQMGGYSAYFEFPAMDDFPIDGQAEKPFTATYVITRTNKQTLINRLNSSGGSYNGIYGECPESTREVFGTCTSDPLSGQSLRVQSNPAIADSYRMLSLQAGNSAPYCTYFPVQQQYNAKLCSYTTERRIRNDVINRSKADIIVVQEMFDGNCLSPAADDNLDRICNTQTLPAYTTQDAQAKRLFNPALYETRCALLADGSHGYECVALRKTLFSFVASSANVNGLAGKIADISGYCSDDSKLGKDTGFFGFSAKLNTPKGADTSSFDIWDAHLATPAPKNISQPDKLSGIKCRTDQMSAFINALKISNQKFLLSGDFNTQYNDTTTDGARLRAISAPWETKDNAQVAVRPGWMVSNSNQLTAYSSAGASLALSLAASVNPASLTGADYQKLQLALRPRSFDHVISNFVDTSSSLDCQRLQQVRGLDHRNTVCDLLGFDSGSTATGYYAVDTTGQVGDGYVSSVLTASRRGAKMPYLKYTGSVVHSPIYLPNGLNVHLELDTLCTYAPIASADKTVVAGTFNSIGALRQGVNRQLCP